MAKILFQQDWKIFQQGDYRIFNNVWGKHELVNGIDYTQTILFDSEDLSGGIEIDWDWGGSRNRVAGFPEIIVGWSPLRNSGTDILSAQVSDIKNFTLSRDMEIGGDTDLFNVSYDFWLTDSALSNRYEITAEVMIWATGGGNWDHTSGCIVGKYSHNGFTADIYKYDRDSAEFGHEWDLVSLIPTKNYTNVTFDVAHIMKTLVRRGLISGDDYLTGYELGAEVRGGKGSWDINDISHTFETYNADELDNLITGTRYGDRISGLGGDDDISGGRGNDVLVGGEGADCLTGGRGRDWFVFEASTGFGDTISDFRSGVDKIVIKNDNLDEWNFSEGAVLKGGRNAGGENVFLYDPSSGELSYDADGSGTVFEEEVIAVLANHTRLRLSDIEIG